jgi:hypothetical protein
MSLIASIMGSVTGSLRFLVLQAALLDAGHEDRGASADVYNEG